MLTKELFIKCIKQIQEHDIKVQKFSSSLEIVFDSRPMYTADHEIVGALIDLLEANLNDTDASVAYFIYDLDFGKKHKAGSITDKNGNDIDFSTAELVYDYLIECNK